MNCLALCYGQSSHPTQPNTTLQRRQAFKLRAPPNSGRVQQHSEQEQPISPNRGPGETLPTNSVHDAETWVASRRRCGSVASCKCASRMGRLIAEGLGASTRVQLRKRRHALQQGFQVAERFVVRGLPSWRHRWTACRHQRLGRPQKTTMTSPELSIMCSGESGVCNRGILSRFRRVRWTRRAIILAPGTTFRRLVDNSSATLEQSWGSLGSLGATFRDWWPAIVPQLSDNILGSVIIGLDRAGNLITPHRRGDQRCRAAVIPIGSAPSHRGSLHVAATSFWFTLRASAFSYPAHVDHRHAHRLQFLLRGHRKDLTLIQQGLCPWCVCERDICVAAFGGVHRGLCIFAVGSGRVDVGRAVLRSSGNPAHPPMAEHNILAPVFPAFGEGSIVVFFVRAMQGAASGSATPQLGFRGGGVAERPPRRPPRDACRTPARLR